MSTTFLEANNVQIYAVLSDFAKCRDSHVKSALRLPNIEGGGGFRQFGQCPDLDCFFFNGFPKGIYCCEVCGGGEGVVVGGGDLVVCGSSVCGDCGGE